MCIIEQKLHAEIATLNQHKRATSPRNSLKSPTVLANKADAMTAGASGQQNQWWAQTGALGATREGHREQHCCSSAHVILLPRAVEHLWSHYAYPWPCIFSSVWLELVILYSETITLGVLVCLPFCPQIQSHTTTRNCKDWSLMCRLTDKTIKISSPQRVWGTQSRHDICK